MTSPLHSPATDELHTLLRQDHTRLEELFERLKVACKADTNAELSALWTEFETGLATHLELEERYLLPRFEQLAPAEAAVLVREHAAIRGRLSQLGIALDLHLARADMVGEFISMLRSHAAREDGLMYRWAQTHVAGAERKALLSYLTTRTRELLSTPSSERKTAE